MPLYKNQRKHAIYLNLSPKFLQVYEQAFTETKVLAFLIFSFSFFSCEQIQEVIKPTPPKSLSCKLTKANGYGYLYDNRDKLIALSNFGSGYTAGDYPLKFEYNEKGQISKGVSHSGDAIAVRSFFL